MERRVKEQRVNARAVRDALIQWIRNTHKEYTHSDFVDTFIQMIDEEDHAKETETAFRGYLSSFEFTKEELLFTEKLIKRYQMELKKAVENYLRRQRLRNNENRMLRKAGEKNSRRRR
jgi:hypothetical protein